MKDIIEIQSLISEKLDISNIKLYPIIFNSTVCDKKILIHSKDQDEFTSLVYDDMILNIYKMPQKVDAFTSFAFWKDSLIQQILSDEELKKLSYHQIIDYGARMGLKIELMKSADQAIIYDLQNNKAIAIIKHDGIVTGRIWNSSQTISKEFNGALDLNHADKFCFFENLFDQSLIADE